MNTTHNQSIEEEAVDNILREYPRLPHEQRELKSELIQLLTQARQQGVEEERERIVKIIKDPLNHTGVDQQGRSHVFPDDLVQHIEKVERCPRFICKEEV